MCEVLLFVVYSSLYLKIYSIHYVLVLILLSSTAFHLYYYLYTSPGFSGESKNCAHTGEAHGEMSSDSIFETLHHVYVYLSELIQLNISSLQLIQLLALAFCYANVTFLLYEHTNN